ncbi:MAG: c-type cytochrome [Bacteroidales bacterium]|nr:c-type cytochrome [Bacteroidales bacterium]
MNVTQKYSLLLFILFIGIFSSSCNHDRNHPGYAYMPDMYYSEPSSAYSDNAVFRDSITNQMPVPGTIARGKMPYPYKQKSFPDQIAAGKELKNPVPVNLVTLKRGREQYQIFCASCHGEKGDGNGHLYTSKLFSAKPTSLIEPYVQDKPDGEIFHIITVGSLSGLMGAHGSQIDKEDRWAIINYVRNELVKK